jgi:hypothetical protein
MLYFDKYGIRCVVIVPAFFALYLMFLCVGQ